MKMFHRLCNIESHSDRYIIFQVNTQNESSNLSVDKSNEKLLCRAMSGTVHYNYKLRV